MYHRTNAGVAFAKMVSGILGNAARVTMLIRALVASQRMKLSKNLTLAEATKSATAIKHGISNKPTGEHLSSLMAIAQNVFQPARDYFGKPIGITSGYRSKALNDLIGGASGSQHSKGEALDLDADVFGGLENYQLFNYIKDNLEFDQLIWEFGDDENPAWVHVSYKASGNRGEVLMCTKQNGKTIYKRWA